MGVYQHCLNVSGGACLGHHYLKKFSDFKKIERGKQSLVWVIFTAQLEIASWIVMGGGGVVFNTDCELWNIEQVAKMNNVLEKGVFRSETFKGSSVLWNSAALAAWLGWGKGCVIFLGHCGSNDDSFVGHLPVLSHPWLQWHEEARRPGLTTGLLPKVRVPTATFSHTQTSMDLMMTLLTFMKHVLVLFKHIVHINSVVLMLLGGMSRCREAKVTPCNHSTSKGRSWGLSMVRCQSPLS